MVPPLSRVWREIRRRDLIKRDSSPVPTPAALQDALHILRLVHRAHERRILDRIRSTPPGFVRTYGDVSPGSPRVAGAVLHDCHDPSIPWHRIVRADGSLAKGERQRALLEAEGVPFRGDRVDMRVARIPDS